MRRRRQREKVSLEIMRDEELLRTREVRTWSEGAVKEHWYQKMCDMHGWESELSYIYTHLKTVVMFAELF